MLVQYSNDMQQPKKDILQATLYVYVTQPRVQKQLTPFSFIYMYMCVCVCVYICMYICVYMYIYVSVKVNTGRAGVEKLN